MSVHSRSNWNLEMLVFEERGKPEYPEKNLSEQSREPTTNSTHIWRRVRESNPSHIGGRRALSPLHHPCSPKKGGSTWTTYSRSTSEHNLVLSDPTFWFQRKESKLWLARWTLQVCKYIKFADSNPTKTRKSSIKLQRRMLIPRMVATAMRGVQLAVLRNLKYAQCHRTEYSCF